MESRGAMIAYGSIVVLSIILIIIYGFWYWDNCAFVPLLEAPTLCFGNN